ncbi:MAG: hypothetical protein FJ280_01360 [Planctomycetes bacterium]|nr:hypothetical protein [Planctomycetota bacterium]
MNQFRGATAMYLQKVKQIACDDQVRVAGLLILKVPKEPAEFFVKKEVFVTRELPLSVGTAGAKVQVAYDNQIP